MNQRINYFECEKGGNHQGETLNTILIDAQEKEKQIICSVCEQELYQSQKSIAIKVFLKSLTDALDNSDPSVLNPNFKQLVQKLDYSKADAINMINSNQENLISQYKKLQAQVIQNYDILKQQLLDIQHSSQQIVDFRDSIINDEYKTPEKLNQDLNQIFNNLKLDAEDQITIGHNFDSFFDQIALVTQDIDQELSVFASGFSKILKKHQQAVTQINIDLVHTQPSSLFFNLSFGENLQGTLIQLSEENRVAEQTGTDTTGQRFSLLQPTLGSTRKIWGIKVQHFVGWIGVGICIQKIIEKAAFQFLYTSTGHGSYLISNNGYTWSHSQVQFNSTLQSFLFALNEIVYIMYDPDNKKVRFRKGTSTNPQDQFDLAITVSPDDEISACVNLCSKGDKVEIINDSSIEPW